MTEDFILHHLTVAYNRRFTAGRLRTVEMVDTALFRLRWDPPLPPLTLYLHAVRPFLLPGNPMPDSKFVWGQCLPLSTPLSGSRCLGVEKVEDDRSMGWKFSDPNGSIWYLVVELRPAAPSLQLFSESGPACYTAGPARKMLSRPGWLGGDAACPQRMAPDAPELQEKIASIPTAQWEKFFCRHMRGMSPTLAREAVCRFRDPSMTPTNRGRSIMALLTAAYASSTTIHLLTHGAWVKGDYSLHPDQSFRFAPFPLQSCPGWVQHSPRPIHDLVSDWLHYAFRWERFHEQRREAIQKIDRAVNVAQKKLDALQRELNRAMNAPPYRLHAEMLLANLHRFGAQYRGDSMMLEDFHQPGLLHCITLQPEKTLKENVDTLFQAQRKTQQALQQLPEAVEQAAIRRDRLTILAARMADVFNEKTLADVQGELPSGPKLNQKRPGVKDEGRSVHYRTVISTHGHSILVGRGARDNDKLTFQVGRPNDWWCHARDYPGAHVLFPWAKSTPPPDGDLREAAAVAAWFSGARESGSVDVHVTQCKFVQKIKGAPGRVRLLRSRCLRVTPALPAGDSGDDGMAFFQE